MEETTDPGAQERITAALRIAATATLRETAIEAHRGAKALRGALLQLHIALHAEPDGYSTILNVPALVADLRELVILADALGDPLLERNPSMTVALFPMKSKLDEPTGIFPSKSIADRVGQALFSGEYVIGPWLTDDDRRRTLALVRGRNPDNE